MTKRLKEVLFEKRWERWIESLKISPTVLLKKLIEDEEFTESDDSDIGEDEDEAGSGSDE